VFGLRLRESLARGKDPRRRKAEGMSLRLFLRRFEPKETAKMALRAGFAAASLLGVVTTFGTTLWVAAVLVLVALVGALVAVELLPRMRASREC
jgi:Flp pilus assembly protein TadB